MSDIKDWITSHNDSIIINDKIEDYEKPAAEFTFHDRLLFEVLSLYDYVDACNAVIYYLLLSVESARTSPHCMFIVRNEVPLAVVSVDSIQPFDLCIDLINENNGHVYAYTSNDPGYLPFRCQLF